MQCPRCQVENIPDARFCEDCGGRLELTCPSCGQPVTSGKKFCRSCGATLTAESDPARFPSPESYTPKHLAQKILTSKAALEGERKQVTVLFADLKGSMELLADRDPEEARKLLDPVLERMMEAVHRYEGTVNQVMGDGIMALFGAPIAHEDHAVRACYAALRMQRRVNLFADEIQRGGGTPVQIRVGLNSGEVVVRAIGSDLHMDYTAVGQTTHLAARMEQSAAPGSILLAGDTLRLVESYVQVRTLGRVNVKGRAEAVETWELLGVGSARTRFQAAAVRGFSRFVGRTTELDALGRVLERARAGYGQITALVGEPGVGKSRLVWEFTHSRQAAGCLTLQSGALPYGQGTPYLPVIDLLKNYFGITSDDDAGNIPEKLAGKLRTLDETLGEILPPLLTLLDMPVADPSWHALSPQQQRQRTLEALKRLLLRESQIQPLLVIFEDLHWIDSGTQALLNVLSESVPAARILLLVNYRPEYQPPRVSSPSYSELRIDPLPPITADELLDALLGEDASLGPVKRVLLARTDGNPLFLEESVRALVEVGVLSGNWGSYRLVRALGTAQIPPSVQAVLAARIDRLPPEDKRVLQAASVIGKDVPTPLLQSIAGLPHAELAYVLGRLQAAGLLYEAHLFPESGYAFKHALTHEVVYAGLLQDRRCALHAAVVQAAEGLYHNRRAEQLERLAYHAIRGKLWERAVVYCRDAGLRANALSAYAQGAAHFEQALQALARLPETRERIEEGIDLRLDLRMALFASTELGRSLAVATDALRMAEALGDERRQARACGVLTSTLFLMGNAAAAVPYGLRALAIATEVADTSVLSWTRLFLGQAYHTLGDYQRAMGFLTENVRITESDGAQHLYSGATTVPSVGSRTWLAWCEAELGHVSRSRFVGAEAIAIAAAVQKPFTTVTACWGVAVPRLYEGKPHEAIPELESGIALCKDADITLWLAPLTAALGIAYARSERHEEGISLLQGAAEESERNNRSQESLWLAWLSEAHLLAGHASEAKAVAVRALDLSRARHERGWEAWTLRLLGEIAAHRAPMNSEPAESHHLQALTLAGSLGMHLLVAHCHLGLGKLYRRTGTHEQSREHLATATTMYREMDMRFWLEQAEKELEALA